MGPNSTEKQFTLSLPNKTRKWRHLVQEEEEEEVVSEGEEEEEEEEEMEEEEMIENLVNSYHPTLVRFIQVVLVEMHQRRNLTLRLTIGHVLVAQM